MEKWIFKGWHFIEVDGEVYILASDVAADLDKIIDKMEEKKKWK